MRFGSRHRVVPGKRRRLGRESSGRRHPNREQAPASPLIKNSAVHRPVLCRISNRPTRACRSVGQLRIATRSRTSAPCTIETAGVAWQKPFRPRELVWRLLHVPIELPQVRGQYRRYRSRWRRRLSALRPHVPSRRPSSSAACSGKEDADGIDPGRRCGRLGDPAVSAVVDLLEPQGNLV